MKTKLLLFMTLVTLGVKGQTNLKTYKGEFDGGQGSYQYYENEDGEQVKHGTYFLILNSGGGNKDYYWKVEYIYSGSYSNNLKTGEWIEKKIKYNPTINVSNYQYNPNTGKYVMTDFKMMDVKGVDEITEIKSTYREGKLNGRFSSVTSVFQKGIKSVKTEVRCEFNQDCFVNEYSFNNGNVIMEGMFNSLGLMTGDWKYKKFDETYSLKYFNGFIIDLIKRNKQGELIERYTNYKPLLLDKLTKLNIKIDTIKQFILSVPEDKRNVILSGEIGENIEDVDTKSNPIILCQNKIPSNDEDVNQYFTIELDLNLLREKDLNFGYFNEVIVTLNNHTNLKETIYGQDRNETDIRKIINDSSEMYRKEILELNSYDLKIPDIKTELNNKLYWLDRDPKTRNDTSQINPIKRKITELDTLHNQIGIEIKNLERKESELRVTGFKYSDKRTKNEILNKWSYSDTTSNFSLVLSSLEYNRENEREETNILIKGEFNNNSQYIPMSFKPNFTDNGDGLILGTSEPDTYFEVYPDIVVFTLRKKLRTYEYFLFR